MAFWISFVTLKLLFPGGSCEVLPSYPGWGGREGKEGGVREGRGCEKGLEAYDRKGGREKKRWQKK